MRDVTTRRQTLDRLRKEALDAWTSWPFDANRVGKINQQLREALASRPFKDWDVHLFEPKLLAALPAGSVALAIKLACQATGADPKKVAAGELDDRLTSRMYPVARARSYAMFSLGVALPKCNLMQISEACGARSYALYNLRASFKQLSWWDPSVVAGIVEALGKHSLNG